MSAIEESYSSDREELEALAYELADIRSQIEIRKARDQVGDEPIDKIWLAKATAALRYKGIRHQELLRDLGEARRKALDDAAHTYERCFMQAARELLSRDQFLKLADRAREIARGANN